MNVYISRYMVLGIIFVLAACGGKHSHLISVLPTEGLLKETAVALTPELANEDGVSEVDLRMEQENLGQEVACTIKSRRQGYYNYYGCSLTYDADRLQLSRIEFTESLGSRNEVVSLQVGDRPGYVALGQCTVGLRDVEMNVGARCS
jgi:hypothetical protein